MMFGFSLHKTHNQKYILVLIKLILTLCYFLLILFQILFQVWVYGGVLMLVQPGQVMITCLIMHKVEQTLPPLSMLMEMAM
ncbi:MAG: hypothetical protein C0459_13080 [Chitinophaga sp.]|nr:hypothetical protein [Chitinophaga sp.]